ncbi:hypothetical protein [Desertivirga brevis]|uniref:hypothetical protein n=1 Tax=Desertivirga brevis TaxID=2810310 RepID=UPI001A970095|nr:hypothetical protein [Pedobacter sp. SYSU D00873]
MKKINYLACAMLLACSACDKQNDNLVSPLVEGDFPQILLLSDEGDGGLEDEDKFSFKITLADRVDPDREELGGKVIPLKEDVTVSFEVTDLKGFNTLSSYIKDAKAFYEIDDCTTSEDQDIDLKLVFDKNTGKGSVTFPAGVEEIEVEFETDEELFDDKVFNTNSRGLEIKLSGLKAGNEKVVVNTSNTFEYKVLDDEGIYGGYELDIKDPAEFQKFLSLFGLVNEDIRKLSVNDVKEIEIEFEYGELKAVVVLKETEEVDDCGEKEIKNKEIEIEADLEEIEDDKLEGDLELEGEVEQENGQEKEFSYKGSFKLVGKVLTLTLKGEYDDIETEEVSLKLEK